MVMTVDVTQLLDGKLFFEQSHHKSVQTHSKLNIIIIKILILRKTAAEYCKIFQKEKNFTSHALRRV